MSTDLGRRRSEGPGRTARSTGTSTIGVDRAVPGGRGRRGGRSSRSPASQRRPWRRGFWNLRTRRPYFTVLGLVAVAVIAAAVVGYATPVLGVRHVAVTGERTLSVRTITAAASIPTGQPLLRVDPGGVAARVAALPQVAVVRVDRVWPDTIRIAVTERTAVGYLRTGAASGTAVILVDSSGAAYRVVSKPPPQLPQIDVTAGSSRRGTAGSSRVPGVDPAARAAAAVAGSLPPPLRARVRLVAAASPDSVILTLVDGRTVVWGGASDDAAKAHVLPALLRAQGGHSYDVSGFPDTAVR